MSSFVVGLNTDSLVYQAVWTFGLEKKELVREKRML